MLTKLILVVICSTYTHTHASNLCIPKTNTLIYVSCLNFFKWLSKKRWSVNMPYMNIC